MYPNPENARAAARSMGNARSALTFGLLAGFAGGLAEILWITAYSAGAGADAARVARGVAEAVGAAGRYAAVPLGVAVHMALAGLLGILVVTAARRLPIRFRRWHWEFAVIVGALAAVWAFNFLVLLPVISPAFVTAVPLIVSFTSKLLFGVSAFIVFEIAPIRG